MYGVKPARRLVDRNICRALLREDIVGIRILVLGVKARAPFGKD
jgi:hypothetical protein